MAIKELSPESVLLRHIFFPHAEEEAKRVQELGGRFVYYTTAATAFKILKNREIWLRSSLTMNDYSEVEHGLQCLIHAYKSTAGEALNQAIDSCEPGLSNEIKDLFNEWIPRIRKDNFIACFSVHKQEEDQHGRLSMWRAYGGNSGVAIVFNGAAFFQESDALATYSSPVAYVTSQQIVERFYQVRDRILANKAFVCSRGREEIKHSVFQMFRFASVSTKHPAFREEDEWRVISSPLFASSDLLRQEVELIGDVPQTVLKLRLEDRPERGLGGLNPDIFIDRVLIGPCDHSDVIYRAVWQLLVDLGIPEPGNRIVNTGIPLRPNQR